jgi:polysaccharide biosynthesis/export protein
MFWRFVIFMAMMVYLGGCATLPPLPPPTDPMPFQELASKRWELPETADTLGPEDVLKVVIYEHPDLSQEVTIGTDGAFVYPLIGKVQAANFTLHQLEEHMTKRLAKDFLVNPQLTITVLQRRSRHVYVLGAVRSPGVYQLKYNATLLELISEAGGLDAEAGTYAFLVPGNRGSRGGTQQNPGAEGRLQNAVSIDLEKVLAGEIRQALPVNVNDIIYVPKRAYIFVTGQVQRPGRYALERDTTAGKAIILAGGFTQFAAKSRLQVRRVVAGEPQVFHANLDDPLQAEDVLNVPESVF